ncbi:glycosyltransferase family 4 protein [Methanosphaerula subterraneus]|uniref:glycosyltransferase family 4 protein n=1 Tax=Methanosphaerula subterraneus TaxID=3350244 RepID=UPI003F852276
MRILRVASDLYPVTVGGYGIHVHEMSKMQATLGHDVTVVTSNPNGLPEEEYVDGYRVLRFNHAIKMVGNTISPTMMFRLLEMRNDYDIIHAHSHLFFPTNVCALVKRYGSSPLVITNHGILSASAPQWLNISYMSTIGKWTLNSADRVICYTDIERRRLIEEFGIDKPEVVVIPNGVNTEVFHPDDSKVDERYFTLLWVGRIVKGKGVEFLIHAAHQVLGKIPNLRIVLIGEGPERDEIWRLVNEYHLTEVVTILPFMSYDAIPLLYQRSDVLVLPSLQEGVPRTMLEAMASGKPVIISEFDHLKDLAEGAALMFPKGDVNALAERILLLEQDRDRAHRMGACGRERILTKNSWKNTVLRTITLYQELLSQDQSPVVRH